MMGVRTLRHVIERSKAVGTDRLVLFVLAEHADDTTGECWPSVDLLAAEAAVKVRAAQYALKSLAASGELAIEPHGAPTAGRLQYRPNRYRVLVSGAQECTTKPSPEVHHLAPLDSSSGARGGNPVVHRRAPKPSVNRQGSRATDDPLTKRAHRLTVLAFEQKPKPLCRGDFLGVLGMVRAALEAENSDDDVRAAIEAGGIIWTKPGLAVAIERAKRTTSTINYDPPPAVYG